MNLTRKVAETGTKAAQSAASPKGQRATSVAATMKGEQPAKGVALQATDWVSANPGTAACLAVGAAAVPLVIAPMAIVAPVLGVAGFGTGGIVGGSAAASAMGSGVAAGSAFATLQSAAMGGYGVAAVSGAVQGTGVAVATASGGLATWLQRKKAVGEEAARAEDSEDEAAETKLQ